MYDNLEQREKLYHLDLDLKGNTNTNERPPSPKTMIALAIKNQKREDDQKREELVQKGLESQGTTIDASLNYKISMDAVKETNCALCRHLQDDTRFLLNPILNKMEIIKNEIRDMKSDIREIKLVGTPVIKISSYDDDDATHCCMWPFGGGVNQGFNTVD